MTRSKRQWLHEGKYAAEVPVELIEDDTAWSPYLTPDDIHKLDTVRLALKRGDVAEAAKHGHVFELNRVAADRPDRRLDHPPQPAGGDEIAATSASEDGVHEPSPYTSNFSSRCWRNPGGKRHKRRIAGGDTPFAFGERASA